MGKKIIVFGTGNYYIRKRKFLLQFEIVAFADNSVQSQGSIIDGVKVIPPSCIPEYQFDYVCVMSSYSDEIRNQLVEMGINPERILDFSTIGLLKQKKTKQYEEAKKCDVILFSHLCNYTGAALALFRISLILKKMGYSCMVYTVFNGDLRGEWEKNGISVIEEDYLDIRNKELCEVLKTKKMIICNTVYMRRFVGEIQELGVPVLWWLHESMGFRACEFEPYRLKKNDSLHVYGVGPLAMKMYKNNFLDDSIQELLYGIPWYPTKTDDLIKDVVTFALIGNISYTKGHDIFLRAIESLEVSVRKKCRFLIIGAYGDRNISSIVKNCRINEIQITGPLDQENLFEWYKEIDVVISTSRVDTMPTVLVEGMMQKKMCIVSPNTGIAFYVKERENGLLLNDLSPKAVRQAITWAIENKDMIKNIGENGYLIYQNYFSELVFENRVRKIIGEILQL